jgi:hypothetical protein
MPAAVWKQRVGTVDAQWKPGQGQDSNLQGHSPWYKDTVEILECAWERENAGKKTWTRVGWASGNWWQRWQMCGRRQPSLSSLCVGVDAVRDTLTAKNLVGTRGRYSQNAAPRYREPLELHRLVLLHFSIQKGPCWSVPLWAAPTGLSKSSKASLPLVVVVVELLLLRAYADAVGRR